MKSPNLRPAVRAYASLRTKKVLGIKRINLRKYPEVYVIQSLFLSDGHPRDRKKK
jgi:hypothetical protein